MHHAIIPRIVSPRLTCRPELKGQIRVCDSMIFREIWKIKEFYLKLFRVITHISSLKKTINHITDVTGNVLDLFHILFISDPNQCIKIYTRFGYSCLQVAYYIFCIWHSNLLKRINFLNVVILELLTDEFLWHSSTARGACVFAVTHGWETDRQTCRRLKNNQESWGE